MPLRRSHARQHDVDEEASLFDVPQGQTGDQAGPEFVHDTPEGRWPRVAAWGCAKGASSGATQRAVENIRPVQGGGWCHG